MNKEMLDVHFHAPKTLLKKFDETTKKTFRNRTEAILYLMREFVGNLGGPES